MGLLDRLQNGVAAGAETASEAFMAQFKSQVEQERQEALVRAQESSRIRTAKAEAGIQLNTRQKSFEQDEANAGLLRARKVADEQAVGQVRNTLERGAAKNKLTDELEFNKKNAKDIAGIERMIAQARHITDPSYQMVQQQDGSVLMVNSKNPKQSQLLIGADGKPVIHKNPEELKAANAILIRAGDELKVAKAIYDSSNKTPADEQEWKNAQSSYERFANPAMNVLAGKSGFDANKQNPNSLEAMFPAKNQASPATKGQPAAQPQARPLLSPAERKARASTEASAEDIKQHEESVAAKKQLIAEEKSKRDEEIRRRNEKRDKEREAMNRLSRIRD